MSPVQRENRGRGGGGALPARIRGSLAARTGRVCPEAARYRRCMRPARRDLNQRQAPAPRHGSNGLSLRLAKDVPLQLAHRLFRHVCLFFGPKGTHPPPKPPRLREDTVRRTRSRGWLVDWHFAALDGGAFIGLPHVAMWQDLYGPSTMTASTMIEGDQQQEKSWCTGGKSMLRGGGPACGGHCGATGAPLGGGGPL
jgi:hypothetical protein